MKKILLSSMLLLIFSCKDSKVNRVDSKPYEAGVQYALLPEKNDIKVKILKIYESRCPSDVTCFWFGYAGVKFEITDGNHSFTDSLYTPAYPNMGMLEKKEFTAGDEKFSVHLKDVTPLPCTKCPAEPEEKRAFLEVMWL